MCLCPRSPLFAKMSSLILSVLCIRWLRPITASALDETEIRLQKQLDQDQLGTSLTKKLVPQNRDDAWNELWVQISQQIRIYIWNQFRIWIKGPGLILDEKNRGGNITQANLFYCHKYDNLCFRSFVPPIRWRTNRSLYLTALCVPFNNNTVNQYKQYSTQSGTSWWT